MARQHFPSPETIRRRTAREHHQHMVREPRAVVWCLLLCVGVARLVSAESSQRTLTVAADQAWTDTGIDLKSGGAFSIDAQDRAQMVGWRVWEWMTSFEVDRRVGPEGTYLWPHQDDVHKRAARRTFPLPAMADGPFPAFCLIGKIGAEGPPFYVGAHHEGVAQQAGRLWLGVNDDRPEDNRGQFSVCVSLAARAPVLEAEPPIIREGSRAGHPLPNARVLLLYVDGLRLDVLREMAQGGFLPNFRRAFLDAGLIVPKAFTVFPSNTLIANGSLWTGRWSDRTGIKSQNQFERATLKTRGQLSAYLPDGFIPPPAAGPKGPALRADPPSAEAAGGGIIPKPATRVINLLDKYAPENTHAFLVKRGVPTLASRLGRAFVSTTLPIIPLNPPPQWFHRAINTLGPFQVSSRLTAHLDAVNADYAIDELLGDADARVVAIWFPMVDTVSHHSRRGQFGAARRDLALADRFLGRILERLRELRQDRSTYLILVSDHGHLGGETSGKVNRACNLPRDWAYRALGCNVKVVGQEWSYPGMDADRFLFFDNQGAGQAKLFLPYGSYFTGPWQRNRLVELTHYRVRPGETMNLIDSLTHFHPPGWDGAGPSPIDLVLIKLDDRRVVVYRNEACQAVIARENDTVGSETYRYEPVSHLAQSEDGELHMDPAPADCDPFGYLHDAAFLAAVNGPAWVAGAHSAREWLAATATTQYPDAVVATSAFFAWRDPVADLALVRDPDLLVTASPGWSFRFDDGEGTDHGYPLAESMRISLILAGPNIPHGTLDAPHRIVDVLPTVLEMLEWPYDPSEIDGQAIRGIYD